MENIFDTRSDFNQDISSWDVHNVTNMIKIFHGKTEFNQNISFWDVSNVTECSDFSLDATSWTLPKLDFTNCSE